MKMKKDDWRKLAILASTLLVIFIAATGGALADRLFGFRPLDLLAPRNQAGFRVGTEQKVIREESVVIDVADRVSPSVVTVAVETPERRVLEFSPFGGLTERLEGGVQQDIGSGFIVSEDGLIVTNKHVVSDESVNYTVVAKDGQEYEVQQISRDPSNDIAILKIDANGLKPVELGDSGNLKVGQFVIAIGTALGEFRHTVTTGVISGLGRGITAGSIYQGYVEELEDVLQTDAAINPGNSGGPLLSSAGQVVGVNVAVASGAENIGFAIPINVVKEGLQEFNEQGSFPAQAFLGVRYQMVGEQAAILNEVPQGAYVVEVISGSPADSAGIEEGDIITSFGGSEFSEGGPDLADAISETSPGKSVSIEIWRNGETVSTSATLSGD